MDLSAINLQLVVNLFAAIGGISGIVAVFMLLPRMKKLQADTRRVEATTERTDAETASTLSAAALAQMNAALARASAAETLAAKSQSAVADLRRDMATMAREHEEDRRFTAESHEAHRAWDAGRMRQLNAAGVLPEDIPPPPPLLLRRPRPTTNGKQD